MDLMRMAQAVNAVAGEAGSLLLGKLGRLRSVEYKGEVDLITEADRESEAFLVRRLGALLPEASILAEEGTGTERDSELRWIVDPLDGTTNFAHTYPVFSVSIGLERAGERVLGVVHDPTRGETFTAVKGGGAALNGEPIHVSATATLDRALLATGFPYDMRTTRRDNLTQFAAFAKLAQGIRRGGSAALDLCQVACGRLDGYWEEKLQPWDVAAGALVVEEAGGRVTGYFGETFDPRARHLVGSNGRIHAEMVDLLTGLETMAGLPPVGR